MGVTRKQVFNKAAQLGVEIDEHTPYWGRHFHAYAPLGKIFIGSSCHNANLGDAPTSEKPDWGHMLNELELEDCDQGPNCDYCHPEEEWKL